MSLLWRRILFSRVMQTTFKEPIPRIMICTCVNKSNINITSTASINIKKLCYNGVRHKSKKQSQYDSDDEVEDKFDDDNSLSRDSKVVKFNSTSLRIDVVLKSALSVSRNKIEQLFYESKIRINGKKVLKKSLSVKIGDEIDIIKMVSPKNPEHIYVSRVEILNATAKEESIQITARRFKNLLIDNYEKDPYKGTAEET